MSDISINYLGDPGILTHPLYLKWSLQTLAYASANSVDLKADLAGMTANQDNLAIASYLATLLRIVGLLG